MSRTEQIEIERKYDVDGSVLVPDLTGAGPVASVEELEPFGLRAVYYDTADHVLLANRITLRRREGGSDAGWHVKLPAGLGARREVHAPLGSSRQEPLPDTLRHVIEIVLRGRPLHAVLVLETTRSVSRLLDADGTQLAELADDEVTATNPDTTSVRAWREWEVELAPGVDRADGEAMLDAVGDLLTRAGASPSASKSKLSRGLGDALPGSTTTGPAPLVELPKKTAGAFVTTTVAHLVADLHALDPQARDAAVDAVHRFRTTVRRLRSVLRVYRGVLDDDETAWLDQSLAGLGRIAGASRDLEVAGQQIEILAARAPEGYVSHESVGRLQATLREAARDASHDLDRAMTDPAYFELLDRLDAVLAVVPTGLEIQTPAKDFVAAALERETKRAGKRVTKALRPLAEEGENADLESLHAARKAVRRLRYALEARKAAGLKGPGSIKAAHAVQDLLGDGLDSAAAADRVHAAADTARWAGEDTFSHGVLATLAVAARDASFARLGRAAKRL